MSAAHQPTSRNAAIVVFALCAGIAVGWLGAPSGANALGYVTSVASPAYFGAMSVYAIRRGGSAARWFPLLLLAVFLLDIARSPHVPSLSALGIAAAASAGIATLRGHKRAAIASTLVSSALLVATLIAGRLSH
ncbi:MAG TPA: hypothetical protein VER96_09395 [Polyangiaceae bacterium]|nr:hypothetical protein [Polyangiaceae bacterium]